MNGKKYNIPFLMTWIVYPIIFLTIVISLIFNKCKSKNVDPGTNTTITEGDVAMPDTAAEEMHSYFLRLYKDYLYD